jgi:hypothetical protein
MDEAPKHPGGRPSKYSDEFPAQARRLALLGLTDEEVASFFEVDVRTVYRWDDEHPEFCQARARGKTHADSRVAEKLYHRALGYRHADVHVSAYQGEVTLTPIDKHYPPDTQAATLWLSNRQGGKWKIKSNTELTGANNGPVQFVLYGQPEVETTEEWQSDNPVPK